MSETLPIIIAGASLVFTALNYINMHYNENSKMKERLTAVEKAMLAYEKEVAELKKDLCDLVDTVKDNTDKIVRLETKMELFWNSMSDMAVDALHKPHKEFAEMDALFVKWKDRTITIDELERLQSMLCELIQKRTSKKSDGDVYWAAFMVARIEAFLADANHSMKILHTWQIPFRRKS